MLFFTRRRTTSPVNATPRRQNKGRPRCRPMLEVLEDRITPNATLTVNSNADTVTPADNKLTLREAMLVNDGTLPVGSLSPIEQLQVNGTPGAANTINFAIPGGPATITLTSALPSVAGALTIQGGGPGPGVITVDGAGQFQVFNVPNGASLTIADMTIANGRAVNGGAIQIRRNLAASNTALNLSDVLFIGNQATGTGGLGGRGGAIYATGIPGASVTVTLSATAFNSNFTTNVTGSSGGAMALENASFQLTSCTFFDNSVNGNNSAGGALAFPLPRLAAIPDTDTNLGGNVSTNIGVLASSTGTISVTTFDNNAAFGSNAAGGALSTAATVDLTVTQSTFSNNGAIGAGNAFGGAIAVQSANGATVTLRQDTFQGNSARHGESQGFSQGGGLAVRAPDFLSTTLITLDGVTVAGNDADEGGGLYFGENGTTTVTLQNTIVATNTAVEDAPDVNSDVTISADHCLIGDPTNSSITATVANGNLVGTAGTPLDPKLGQLAFYGGLTQTMILEPGSPAIDTGTNADNQTTDQRGLPRQIDGDGDYDAAITDIGAVEVGIIATLDATPRVITIPPPNQIINYTATLSNDGPDISNSVYNTVIDPNTTHVGQITATPIAVDHFDFIFNNFPTFDAVAAAINPDGNGPVTVTSFSRVPEFSSMAGTLTLTAGVFTYTGPTNVNFGSERFQYTIKNGDGLSSIVPGYLTFSVGSVQAAAPITPLAQSQLNGIVTAARQRWESTGLTASQDAVLQQTQFFVTNLAGSALAATAPGYVFINASAGGLNWFVDGTPQDNSEFANALSPTRLAALAGTPQANEMDLLTVVMNEMGRAMSVDPMLAPDLFSTPVAGIRDLPPGANLAPVLDQLFADHGFHFQGSYFQDWLHHGEKWFQDNQNQWYFITADGNLYHWNNGDFAGSTLADSVDPLLYADPNRLFGPAAQLSGADLQQLNQLQSSHGFHFTGSYYLNWLGQGLNEKWFEDNNNQWFYITPNGNIYPWGSSAITTVNVAVYIDPAALFLKPSTLSAAAAQDAVTLHVAHGFHFAGSYYQDWLGQNEKWFQDSNNQWFFITQAGGLYQWGGGDFAGSTSFGSVNLQLWADPTQMFNLPAALSLVQSAAPLTQAQLNSLISAAQQVWLATGLTAAQQAALQNLTFSIGSLSGGLIGSFTPGHVNIDVNAGGLGWFVDATPSDNAEFTGSAPDLFAAPLSAPAGHVDLLTVVVHEMGHALGLADENTNPNDVMYTYLGTSERRLPTAGEAVGAVPGSFTGIQAQQVGPGGQFLGTPIDPVNIGTFPAGKAIKIFYQAQVNNPFPLNENEVGSQGTLTGIIVVSEVDHPSVSQNTDDPTTAAMGDPTFVQIIQTPTTGPNKIPLWVPDMILQQTFTVGLPNENTGSSSTNLG